ncbi:MAG: acyl carrier protein [Christensenellaceae bacterium]|jgi:acyl carrier protein|nr:acyl carrier protein [Christensenellaceae bacterium]
MTMIKVAAILAEHLDKDASEITAESSFESLGLDSLDTVEIVMELEDEFGVSIEMDESIKSVADLVRAIDGGK